ncbi:MAG: hypothetical protein J2P47_05345 [Acetobacteraceae bacterium]|nr:hypothetical protein [Acetobacteraceae bacterium]
MEAYIPALPRYAFAHVRDRQEADDLVHDCLVRALDRMHACRSEPDLRPRLFVTRSSPGARTRARLRC